MSDKLKGYELTIKNVDKTYDGRRILKDLNLSIKQGEFVAIVGRSGCGKSTLLRLISSLEKPSSGEILIDGKFPSLKEQKTKLLFQDARLIPWKKVWENISLVSNLPKEEAVKNLSQVGLGNLADKWPDTLSGGQKQRVALARALSSDPALLLLDEPLGALDALTRLEMQHLIEKLHQEHKFTAILVTHDVEEAVTLADRVILLDKGEVSLNEEIRLSRPRTPDDNFNYYKKQILEAIMNSKGSADDAYSI